MELVCKGCDQRIETVKVIHPCNIGYNAEITEECPKCGQVYESYDVEYPYGPVRDSDTVGPGPIGDPNPIDEAHSVGPIIEFKTQEELDASLKEWAERLFLTDWTIRAIIATPDDMLGKENAAENSMCVFRKSCEIKILKDVYISKKYPEKECAECALVHELLNCKFNFLQMDHSIYEKQYFDTIEHALLEQMAKSLIMARYDVPFSWFKNF